jgi:hypothetical protein
VLLELRHNPDLYRPTDLAAQLAAGLDGASVDVRGCDLSENG